MLHFGRAASPPLTNRGSKVCIVVDFQGTIRLWRSCTPGKRSVGVGVLFRSGGGGRGRGRESHHYSGALYPFTDRLVLQYTILVERWCQVNADRRKGF